MTQRQTYKSGTGVDMDNQIERRKILLGGIAALVSSYTNLAYASEIQLDGKVFSLQKPKPRDEGTEYVAKQTGDELEIKLLKTPGTSRRNYAPVLARFKIVGQSGDRFSLEGSYYVVNSEYILSQNKWEDLRKVSYIKMLHDGKVEIGLEASGSRGLHGSILLEK